MLNNILKVYGEDLAAGALNQASIATGTGIAAGSTQGALCVNAFAVGRWPLTPGRPLPTAS